MNANEFLHPFVGCNVQQRAEFTNQVLIDYEDGKWDLMKLHSAIKNLSMILDTLSEAIKPDLIDLAGQSKEGYTGFGFKITSMEGGVKYDFSKTNDHIYSSLLSLKKKAEADLKEREKFLKTIPYDGASLIDEDSGEIVKIYPPIKSSITTVKTEVVE